MKTKIGVIVDWKRSSRTNVWDGFFKTSPRKDHYQVTVFPLADLLIDPLRSDDPWSLNALQEQNALIINWDAINGDPDFGASLASTWIDHRRPELMMWIRDGNVLIIESQAVFGVPSRGAYDAVLGKGELPLCEAPDKENPIAARALSGARCRRTKAFPTEQGFESVPEVLAINTAYVPERMFPSTTSRLLSSQVNDTVWAETLYRGWFRRKLPWSGSLAWTPLLRTDGRGALQDHATLMVARLGRGAIFASTMMLSCTGQVRLVDAMINCTGGNAGHLPQARSLVRGAKSLWKHITSLAAILVALAAFWPLSVLVDQAATLADVDRETVVTFVPLGFTLIGFLFFEILIFLIAKTVKWLRAVIGY